MNIQARRGFLVPGLNTSYIELEMLRNAVFSIRPDRIQLNYLDRPELNHGYLLPNLLLKKIQEFLLKEDTG